MCGVHEIAERKCTVVCAGAEVSQPLGERDDAIELFAMNDEQALAVGGLVDDLAHHFDAAVVAPADGTQKLIVISRYQDAPCAVIHFAL